MNYRTRDILLKWEPPKGMYICQYEHNSVDFTDVCLSPSDILSLSLSLYLSLYLSLIMVAFFTESGNKRFRCTIKIIDKRVQVTAVAKTLKLARKVAAKRALGILKMIDPVAGNE